MYERKEVAKVRLAPLAAAYVGYIVLCNLNLNINPVGFYQITKIAGACTLQANGGQLAAPSLQRQQGCSATLAAGSMHAGPRRPPAATPCPPPPDLHPPPPLVCSGPRGAGH